MVEAVLEPILQLEAQEALWAEGRFLAAKIDQGKLLTTSEAKRYLDLINQLRVHL